MILTYKIKHGGYFSDELKKAKLIAEFAIKTKSDTSKDVRHIGLPSAISNQILRKYRRRGIKKVSSVKLTVPGQSVQFDTSSKTARISCLHLNIDCRHIPYFNKIRQIEIGKEFANLSVDVPEIPMTHATKFLGIDCNTTGHTAVVAIPHTGKIHKFGKSVIHIHTKYMSMRKRLQKHGKYRLLRQIKHRESNIVRNLNHQISKKIVQIAMLEQCGIKFEDLKGIRKNKNRSKSFRYPLNSWSYYQFQKFTEYKAKKQGIEVAYVAPTYTSQTCSKCGSLGNRQDKRFQCAKCGHADHADVNASFNIGNPVSHCTFDPFRIKSMSRLHEERDSCKGSPDTQQTATPKMMVTVKPTTL